MNIVESKLIEAKRQRMADVIQEARVQKGWTQQELADRVGIQRQTVNKIELCRYSPNIDVLYLILDCLEIPLEVNKKEI